MIETQQNATEDILKDASKDASKDVKNKPGRSAKNKKRVLEIVKIAERYPDKSQAEIAEIVGIDKSNVNRALKKYGLRRADIDGYKNNRADILAGLQTRVLQSVTDVDIEKAPFRDKIVALGILFDKERLERGQSTGNLALTSLIEVLDKRDRAAKKNKN